MSKAASMTIVSLIFEAMWAILYFHYSALILLQSGQFGTVRLEILPLNN